MARYIRAVSDYGQTVPYCIFLGLYQYVLTSIGQVRKIIANSVVKSCGHESRHFLGRSEEKDAANCNLVHLLLQVWAGLSFWRLG